MLMIEKLNFFLSHSKKLFESQLLIKDLELYFSTLDRQFPSLYFLSISDGTLLYFQLLTLSWLGIYKLTLSWPCKIL